MKLFIDQNMPKLVMAWLRQKGFEIVLLSDVNLRRASDVEIALFAMQNGLAVLTQDIGFAKMYRTQYRRKLTVILVNTKAGTAQSVIKALDNALLKVNLNAVQRQLVFITERKVRVFL
ncbi:MAG: DUF5615 family PIN-like protein [Nitrososphaerota archaeon]|nr:DUF5615 family PIN-like protein [Nitrososphaerota archaeon]